MTDANSKYLYAELDREAFDHARLQSPATYAEDRAFLNHLKDKDLTKLKPDVIRKLLRVAQTGVETRGRLDKWKAKISLLEWELKEAGHLQNGLKYPEIFRKARERIAWVIGEKEETK